MAFNPHVVPERRGVVRNPLSLKRLVYIDGQQAVIYRGLRLNPTLGQNFEAMDPLEWLGRMADHIPDPGKHRTLFYAHYAHRVRGEPPPEEVGSQGDEKEPPKKRRCSPSWAKLIAKVFTRIRSCANAAVARSKSLPTSRTPSPSAGSWIISI